MRSDDLCLSFCLYPSLMSYAYLYQYLLQGTGKYFFTMARAAGFELLILMLGRHLRWVTRVYIIGEGWNRRQGKGRHVCLGGKMCSILCRNFVPQTDATTFAFASLSILLQWSIDSQLYLGQASLDLQDAPWHHSPIQHINFKSPWWVSKD